jgi:4-carboxymuconolactone decarboxylase
MPETRFPELTPETMTAEQRRVAEVIQSGPRGAGLRGPFNALLRSPELADAVQKVGEVIRFRSSIPAPLNELAILVTGRKWMAQYEFYAHRQLGLRAGMRPEIADAVAEGKRPEGMGADEADVYDFASELLTYGEVSDAIYARALARFGERGVIDLVGACGYYSLVSMVLNVAQVPLPPGETPPLRELSGGEQ